ncbi:hypothetical protein D3C80_1778000 [compost metagenome]
MAVAGSDAQAEHGGDVDDAPAALGTRQTLRCTLGHAPDAVEVGRQHVAPVLLADLKHALAIADTGIVEHHVDDAERGFGSIKGGFDAGPIGDVHGHCQGLAAVLTQGFG